MDKFVAATRQAEILRRRSGIVTKPSHPQVMDHVHTDQHRLADMTRALLILTAFFLSAAPLQPDTGAQMPPAGVIAR